MTNIIGVLNHLKNIIIPELLKHDVTILSIRIEENEEVDSAFFVVHCRMDEWFMTWASEYYHRTTFTSRGDMEYVSFLEGHVFALHIMEDL